MEHLNNTIGTKIQSLKFRILSIYYLLKVLPIVIKKIVIHTIPRFIRYND